MRLKKIISFNGTIVCKTGLHIGGLNNQIKIGGVDSEVIKHPVTQEPYIPGSSLKGKMRSQLEKKLGRTDDSGNPCGCGRKDCPVCLIFGAHIGAHNKTNAESAPTRIIVRDAYFTDKTRKEYNELLMEKGLSYLEQKAENIINRKKGTAVTPRFIERVPEGTEFEFNIQLQIFDGDDEELLVNSVEECLKLVEYSYLGGSGSRGYGQVEFKYEKKEKEL